MRKKKRKKIYKEWITKKLQGFIKPHIRRHHSNTHDNKTSAILYIHLLEQLQEELKVAQWKESNRRKWRNDIGLLKEDHEDLFDEYVPVLLSVCKEMIQEYSNEEKKKKKKKKQHQVMIHYFRVETRRVYVEFH